MKHIITATVVLIFTASNIAYAQEKCAKRTLKISDREDVPASWTECVGTVKFSRKAEERAGDKYVGEFKNGKMSGQGTYTWANGDKHVGGWRFGYRFGQGTYTGANGDKSVGEFRLDELYNGQATETEANGVKFIGEYKEGQAHGTATWANGDEYVGEWYLFSPHGQGTKTWAGEWKGQVYAGEWEWGLYNGQGTLTYKSGAKYVGEWKEGKKNGQGTFTWGDGDKYVGEWKEDKKNGQGTYTYADGRKYVGEWKEGKYNGQGTFTSADGDKYFGEWKEGKRWNGQGTKTYASGGKYVGEWKEGKYNGQGTFTWAGEWKGQVYVGEWKEGKYNGQGTMTYKSGQKYVGEWKEDKRWNGIETSLADSDGWETHFEYKNGEKGNKKRIASKELLAKQAAEKAEQLARQKAFQEKVKATKVDKNKCYTYYAHNYNLYVEGLTALNQTARANAQSFIPQMQQNIYDQTMKTHTDNAQMLRQEAERWKAYGGGIDSKTSRYLKVEVPVVDTYLEIFQMVPQSSLGLLGALVGGEEEFIDHPLRYVSPACVALKASFKNSAENPF